MTGTDEHGEKIAAAAKARGLQPKMHCDEMVVLYKELWDQVGVDRGILFSDVFAPVRYSIRSVYPDHSTDA